MFQSRKQSKKSIGPHLIEDKLGLSEIMELWETQYQENDEAEFVMIICECESNFNLKREYRLLI